ncbi:MAG: nuclease-related domain-containing protein, partial [Verrucomicrobiota bacterium]
MQEDKAGKILREKFPYAVLSNIPLFRSDTPEEHLYANQADHLVHLRKGDHEKLVIVECKENVLRRWSSEKSRPIVDSSKYWFALYFGKAKDSKKQVRNQARALHQNLNLQFIDGPRIEGWVVHSGKHPKEIKQSYDDGVLLIAMTANLFRKKLKRMKQQGWKAVSVYSSEYLSQLHLGRREENFPHPIIIDALDHIRNSRLSLDGGIFTKLRFGQKRSHWAISGAAGSGKSVLLAYSMCVFATDYWIQRAPDGSILKVLEPVGDKLPAAMPPLSGRRIYGFAMSLAQVEALSRYFDRFRSEFQLLNGAAPAMAPITFAQWNGEIPDDCTVLAIDEAQDLCLISKAQ